MQLKVPIRPEMVFKIGSMSKQFTAIAIMLLIEQRKLSLETRINNILPEYPSFNKEITVKHLLSHTSGMNDYIDWAKIREDLSLNELINSFKDKPLIASPGEKYRYSNPGYVLLGAIIEKVSGQTYEDFITENVINPLNLNNTYYGSNSKIIPNLVRGYRKRDDKFINAPYMSMTHPYAAGSLLSNVDDLVKWNIALFTGKITNRESLDQCFTSNRINNGELTGYGFGWYVGDFKGRKNLSHGGGVYGFVSHAMMLPDEGVYVAVLSNRIIPDAVPGTSGIAEMIASIIIGEPINIMERIAISLEQDKLNILSGTFYSESKGIRKIMVEDNHIYFGLNKERRLEIYPETETVFFIKGAPGSIIFNFDDKGNVTHFVIDKGSDDKTLYKKQGI
jgi:CubicO group peptidase (beta-lactamase class C family)